MPAYNASATSLNKPVLTPGRPITVWDALASPPEEVKTGDASQQVSLHRSEYQPHCLSVEFIFEGDPGAMQVDLQTADTDAEEFYCTKGSFKSSDTPLNASFAGRIEATNVVAKFARLKMVALTNSVAVTARIL